ncbi:MAG: beta-ketoacyl-[acyl-carrier-protein] synthase family protein [Verrucomicrobia bacterium]|nr:MAG: beta-ketoacyl-[acyl-carrier-protein] synthase family protein [Verrucomicrobiota bacterium]
MSQQRVFITGMGFVSSIGNDGDAVADSLIHLRHGIEQYPPFDKPDSPVKVLGTIKGFEVDSIDFEDWTYPERYRIKREVLRGLAPHGVYAYCSMLQAIEDAGLDQPDISNGLTGLYAASAGSPFLMRQNFDRMDRLGVMRCSPTGIVASIAGTLNFNLVAAFQIRGVSCGFSSACASSGHGIGYAMEDIRSGRQKRVFVVGAEDCNRYSILPFAGMRALSLKTDPTQASQPFDVDRSGFVGTGGACVMVLESEDEVERRGVAPYAELAGWGQASDGHNVAMSHPDGIGLRDAMRLAINDASLQVGDINHINAHATSTSIGDISEVRAIKSVFGVDHDRPLVSSTKALTGHGLSLSSVLEAGFVALGMRRGFTPGSAHIRNLDPECEGVAILRETIGTSPDYALCNSSGFGGSNVVIVLKKN